MTARSAITSKNMAYAGAHIVGAALLLWVAIVNGFPLMFVDTGTYLRIGTEHYFPIDRPIIYGLVIAPLHPTIGLWGIVVVQALFSTWLVGRVVAALTGRRSPWLLMLTMLLLSAFSSLPWVAAQIMPDLFTGMIGLLIFLIVFAHRDLAQWEKWILPLLLIGMVSFHYSHLPIGGAIAVVAIIGAWAMGDREAARIGGTRALGAVIVAALGLCAINLVAAGSFRPSLMSNTFLFVKLLDEGLAQKPLDDVCRERPLIVCAARPLVNDPAEPLQGQAYLWSKVRLQTGDAATRLREEEAMLVRRTFTTQPIAVIRRALIEAGRQIVTARVGDGLDVFDDQMQVTQQIERHFPASAAASRAALQQHGGLAPLRIIPDRWIALLSALLSPLLLIAALRRHDRVFAGFVIVAVTTVLANGALCGMLSWILDRYQSRALWVLPLLAIVALYRLAPLFRKTDGR